MENSGSDTESECFESAEESLDECEETKIFATKTKNSESEVAEPVCDNVGSASQLDKDVSGNLMSYRKRPERVKRSNSNKTANSFSKLPSPDAIFRSDKIVPDAFFQDITNNLSKNVNKSLSKLQQKSSNVKDLILNSLPVSSINDDEGFSYDDDTVQVLPVESSIPTTKADSPDKNNSDELIRNVTQKENTKKEEDYGKEILTTETNSTLIASTNGSNKERKPPDIGTETPEESCENLKLKGNILLDKVEREVNSFMTKESQDVSDCCINKEDGESYKDKGESLYDLGKESVQISTVVLCNYSNTKILQEEDEIGASNNKINRELVNFSDQTSGKNEITEPIPSESLKTEVESDSKQNSDKKFVESAELNKSSFVGGNLIFSEHEESKKTERFGSLGKNNEKKLNNFQGDSKVDSNCNLEELKTALENIVKDKESSLNENNKKYMKDGSHEEIKEIIDVNQSSNDGWEDFDFSDNEDCDVNKTGFGEVDIKEKGHNSVVAERRSVSDNTGANPPTNTVNKSANNLVKKEISNVEAENKEGLNLVKKPKLVSSVASEAVSDDTWDWDDDWGETPGDKNEVTDVTESPKSNKIKDEPSDISKWSGWDTFAQKPQEKQANWSLGSWGVDMLLNKATAVTLGISNVLEAGLGAPDPATFARMEKIEREKLKEEDREEDQEYSGEVAKRNSLTNVNLFPVSGITSLVAGVTSKIVEHSKIQEIGSKVITGGLDTLETFGKKTMEVLQEGDPGLKNKRALLMGNNKPVLSQVLREAREKADREIRKAEEKEMAKKCHFETLFDDFQGMVHLEALEMLSRQCELKLEQIRSGMNLEEQEDLNGILEEVEQLCSLDECELDFKSSVLDFKTLLQMAVEPLKNEISVHKIIQIHDNVNEWLETSSETQRSLIVVNQKLVSTLAELAAATVQQFHKSGELLSVKECRQTVKEVDALSRLTNVLCTEINRLCERFMLLSHCKTSEGRDDGSNSMSEKVTLVMNNSTSYIRQAFDLLIPVIQLGAAV